MAASKLIREDRLTLKVYWSWEINICKKKEGKEEIDLPVFQKLLDN